MPSLHNARTDRVATARSWRGSSGRGRAVLPAAGYYEWLPGEDAGGRPVKQPYSIHPADGVLSFAGLYERWPDPADCLAGAGIDGHRRGADADRRDRVRAAAGRGRVHGGEQDRPRRVPGDRS
jgi:putative SOS response-associated peptidase YedK